MNKLISLWKNNQQIIRYLIFGVLTTLVSLVIYGACVYTVLDPQDPIQLAAANVLSWIGAVTFAYFTNRKYVFQSNSQHQLREAGSFFLSRIGTLLLDVALMHAMVQWMGMNDKIAKLIVQVVVIVANYVLSRFFVFRKGESA